MEEMAGGIERAVALLEFSAYHAQKIVADAAGGLLDGCRT